MKTIVTYLLNHLIVSADGNLKDRFFSSTILAMIATPFVFIGEKLLSWTLENKYFITIVLGAVLIDWIFGSLKHLIHKSFKIKKNAVGLVLKLVLVSAGAFLFEGLHFIMKDWNLIAETLKIITRLVVFIYPAISAWDNMSIVSNGKFPPKIWLKKMKRFNDTLDIHELQKKEAKDENK